MVTRQAAAKPAAKKAAPKKAAPLPRKLGGRTTAKKQPAIPATEEVSQAVKNAREANVAARAMEVLATAGITLEDVFHELMPPMEADEEVTIRQPLRPTLKVVQSKPIAVVMLEWDANRSEDFYSPLDRDSELFTDLDLAQDYFDINVDWATNDVTEVTDARHLVVFIKDTSDLGDFKAEIRVPKGATEFEDGLRAKLDAGEFDFIFSGNTSQLRKEVKAKKTSEGKAKVVGRRVRSEFAPTAKKSSEPKQTAAQKRAAAKAEASKEYVEDLSARLKEARNKPKAAPAPVKTDADGNGDAAPKPAPRKAAAKKRAPAQKPSAKDFVGVSERTAQAVAGN